MAYQFEGVNRKKEEHIKIRQRDIRTGEQKLKDKIATSSAFTHGVYIVLAAMLVITPFLTELIAFLLAIYTLIIFGVAERTLPISIPLSSKRKGADGMFFLGNDIENNNEEIWISNDVARRHMLIMGTTGAGKTEALLSISYNMILTGSGFIFSDGKGTFELYAKTYILCRSIGIEDDLLLMSFLTGGRDIRGPQTTKVSNTLNPFSSGSAAELSQLLISLMSSGSGGGGDMWEARAAALMECIMAYLVYRRDEEKVLISIDGIRNTLILNEIYNAWKNSVDNKHKLPDNIESSLHAYLVSLAGFDADKPFADQQDSVSEQHGYLFMQFTKILGSLTDVYGYIFNVNLSEINFWDVVVNRRVLIVLLPALSKSQQELSMLGKVIVACVKRMMSSGSGEYAEGNVRHAFLVNPTNNITPYLVIFDEYGYYSVKGGAVIPAQARGLNFMTIYAGQDKPAFETSSKEDAESIIANTKVKVCMALEDPFSTFDVFAKAAGEAEVAVSNSRQANVSGFSNGFKDTGSVSIDKRSRITILDLKQQKSGFAHIIYEGVGVIRIRFFYVGIELKNYPTQNISVNQFIKVNPPSIEKAEELNKKFDKIKNNLINIQYIVNLKDEADLNEDLHDETLNKLSVLIDKYYKEHKSFTTASCATIAQVLYEKNKEIEEQGRKYNINSTNNMSTEFLLEDEDFLDEDDEDDDDEDDNLIKSIDDDRVTRYGRRKSEFEDDYVKKSMVIDSDMNSIEYNKKKTIQSIQTTVSYPKDIPDNKSSFELAGIIEELNDMLDKDFSNISDLADY